ncbi:GPI transamidase component PIG-S isoform X1 [Amyelois transitella]|uniref:GPI transamidase component PIG-S isoform X1 n=1 Tax=Amyelois transitella TaxID=680683 RepID=UPI00298F8F2D|nr:GPI transamidase component PIG-S isoform X1 [Amyelois transitella]
MTKQGRKPDGDEWSRMWASASFVGVLIIIGLPLWWKTTEVYRVSLPYDKINSFDGEALMLSTDLTVLANDEPTASEIAGLIEKDFEEQKVIKLNIKKLIISDQLRHSLDSVADEAEALEEVAAHYDISKHNTFFVVQRKPLYEDVWLSGERVAFFRDAKASPTLVEVLKQWVYQTDILEGARSATADSARRSRFPPASGYHVVLSVVHPRPDSMKVEFDAGQAMEDYIGSFVDELSELHNFTLSSQWLYLLDFDFQAKEVKDTSEWGRHFAVRQDKLHLLLTKLEERAATQVSALPTINLALYVLPCERAPLAVYDEQDRRIPTPVQAFMSPKWGGVYLGNPEASECQGTPEYRPTVRLIMGTFIAQLRKLLGITDKPTIPGAFLDPLRAVPPRRWELDSLLALRTLEQLASSQGTLRSLAQLLGEISNIVINDEVGVSINAAVAAIEDGAARLASGELLSAHRSSQRAHSAAETAFMEPSLLALLYFPDDQKYAIYIPLFLPIMFPVILSLKNLLFWLRGKPKEKVD